MYTSEKINSQPSWYWQNPIPTGESIYSITFTNINTGFIAGAAGQILITTNSGINWTLQSSPTLRTLGSISFTDSLKGIIVGDSGTILRTENAGSNWISLTSGTNNHLRKVKYLSTDIVISIGDNGTILRSTDSGNNWTSINSGTTGNLYAMSFIDRDSGFISTNLGAVLKTTNGGINWQTLTSIASSISSISFINAFTGVAAGGSGTFRIFRTTDGGDLWTTVNMGYNFISDITYLDTNKVIAVGGYYFSLLYSTNSGVNWSSTGLSGGTYYSVCKVSNEIALAAGTSIVKTTSSGLSWNLLSSQFTHESITDIDFINANTGTLVGHGITFKTTNGGINWFSQILPGLPPDTWLNSVDIVNSNVGAVVGRTNFIYRTTNGGNNWIPQFRENTNELNSVYFVNESFGAACGAMGSMFTTTNGGINWILQNSGTTSTLNSIFFADINTGFVGSSNGKILKTTDGGINWFQQSTGITLSVNTVFFINSLTGFASAGSNSTSGPANFLKTTNGGENWNIQLSTTGRLNSISFTDENAGYILSRYSRSFLKTTNGGNNWESHFLRTTIYPVEIYFANTSTGWVVGESGMILKTTNSGVILNTQLNNINLPTDFILYQNYPNPFNPNTVISYQLAVSDYISLKVYDVLGIEVATLVNEKQSAGSYEVNFDASNYPSGIYFYKIETEHFTQTKKMVLVR